MAAAGVLMGESVAGQICAVALAVLQWYSASLTLTFLMVGAAHTGRKALNMNLCAALIPSEIHFGRCGRHSTHLSEGPLII